LLPAAYHRLKPVGRLDKDSSGLLLLTDDGQLANQLTHPSYQKVKVYQVQLDRNLTNADQEAIEAGVKLEDGLSRLGLSGRGNNWQVQMSEGRNRQIRRTFEALGYRVIKLHRTGFGPASLAELPAGAYREVSREDLQ
jgi:23S rRNA pseudouridine2605 synthase